MSENSNTSGVFRALADPTRIALLRTLDARGELAVGALATALGQPQPKTSTHLALLRRAGLVETRREHRLVHYRLADDRVGHLIEIARSLLEDHDRLVDPAGVAAPTERSAATDPPPDDAPLPVARAGMHVVLRLGGELFALPADQVREVLPYRRARRVPSSFRSLLGMVDVRGSLVETYRLASALGVEAVAPASIAVVFDRRGRTAGLAVDGVEGVQEIDARSFRPAGTDAPGVAAIAVTDRGLVLVLDTDSLIARLRR